ncbi:MAG TPA: asparagine synthase-related protein, partial [Bacteroidales bacterium]|nr:asparagine synthase-related protein [Bacteroidales bacterium]
MNSFTGIYFPDNPQHPAIEVLRNMTRKQNFQLLEEPNLVIQCQQHTETASNNEWLVVTDAAFYNKEEMASRWGLPAASLQQLPAAEFILQGLSKKGVSFTDGLVGDFAIVAYHQPTDTLYCFRDQHGFRPLYYYRQNGLFFFSNQLTKLSSLPGVDQTPDMEFVVDTLAGIKSDKERTSCQHIFRLLPAHFMKIQDNHTELKRYWDFDLSKEIHYTREEDYVEAFRELLQESIACRLEGDQVGAELSGGLDSSVIAAVAAGLLSQEGRSLQTFSHAHPPEKDTADVFPKDEK